MRVIPVGGFLGAGKTTLLWEAARRLTRRGHSVGLVTNDQVPDLVDTAFLSRSGARVREVAGSCFCCNFDGFVEALHSLEQGGADCVLAEPVGSCTDLSATILQPLKALVPRWRLSPLTVLVDPSRIDDVLRAEHPLLHADAAYILHLQLEEADRILLSKADTLAADRREAQVSFLSAEFPQTPIGYISALDGQGLDEWIDDVLRDGPAGTRIATVDYDRYANGEAVLGWLNAVVDLTWADTAPPDWESFLARLCRCLHEGLRASQGEIGHIKMLLDSPQGRIMANLTGLNQEAAVRTEAPVQEPTGTLTVNARAQVSPESIEGLFRDTLERASAPCVATEVKTFHCIRPGRPQPTHRYDSVLG